MPTREIKMDIRRIKEIENFLNEQTNGNPKLIQQNTSYLSALKPFLLKPSNSKIQISVLDFEKLFNCADDDLDPQFGKEVRMFAWRLLETFSEEIWDSLSQLTPKDLKIAIEFIKKHTRISRILLENEKVKKKIDKELQELIQNPESQQTSVVVKLLQEEPHFVEALFQRSIYFKTDVFKVLDFDGLTVRKSGLKKYLRWNKTHRLRSNHLLVKEIYRILGWFLPAEEAVCQKMRDRIDHVNSAVSNILPSNLGVGGERPAVTGIDTAAAVSLSSGDASSRPNNLNAVVSSGGRYTQITLTSANVRETNFLEFMRSKYKELTLANVIFAMGKPVLDLPRKIINRVVNRAQTDVGAHQRERRNELLSAQRALPPSTPTLEAKNKSDSNSFKGIQTLAVTDSSRSKPTEINSARTTRQKFGLANAVFEAGTFALGILYKKTKIHARQDAINNILSLIVIHHKNENNGGIVAGSNPLVLHKIASTPSTSLGFLTPKKEHGSNSVFSTPKANTLLVSPNIPSLSPSTTDRIGTPILDSSTPEGVGTPDLSSSSLEGVGTPSLGSSSPEGVGTPTLDSSTPEGVGTPDLSSSSLEGVGTPNLCSPNYEKEEEPDLKFPNSAEGNTKSSNFSEVEELGSPIQRPKKGKPRGAKIKNPRRLFDDLVETSSGSDDKENKVKIIPNIVIKYSTETPEGKVNMAVKLPPKAVTKLFQSIGDDGRRKKVNMEEVQSSGQSGSPLASVDMNKLK